MTRQRALILGIMREKCPEHLTADEIFSHARQAMPHIARGTVYRNLKLMELDGEIGHLEMPDGPDRYDANPTPHGHLLCDSCRHRYRGSRLHADDPLHLPEMPRQKRAVRF